MKFNASVNDENDELSEEKFATDLLQQIEDKVAKKLQKAGIHGVSVKVNRADYTLSFRGDEAAIDAAKKFLDAEKEAQLRDREES